MNVAQLAGDVEYTDCFSRYDTKQSDGTIYQTPPLGQDMTIWW